MSANPIRISRVCRITESGDFDSLTLEPGVNVVVGNKGTGKTAWLRTISFLLGDTDSAEETLTSDIAEKFDAATMHLTVGAEDAVVVRRWKEPGLKTSVVFDGQAIKKDEFSQYFLSRLDIPIVRFPKGSPYSGGTWPQLSWRMLFRHIYRQEVLWRDFADKQPVKEQHACLAQFLGAADRLYPTEFGQEIDRQRELLILHARKDLFEEVLREAAREIVPDPAISNAPTLDAFECGVARLRAEIDQFRRERESALAALSESEVGARLEPIDTRLGERRVQLAAKRAADRDRLSDVEKRFAELSNYREQAKAELARLRRAVTAGELFKPLAVTCCPFCDQRVAQGKASSEFCYVCQQPMPAGSSNEPTKAATRLAFEVEQLEGEESELVDLIGRLASEREVLRDVIQRLDGDLAEVEVQLRPLRSAAAAIIPPEVAVLDTRIGQWEEKVAQLRRLKQAVERRNDLSERIDRLQAEVEALSDQVNSKSESIPFEQLSDAMSDGINSYLNLLKEGDPTRWSHPPMRFEFSAGSFRLRVGTKLWTGLSNADRGYVLLGYHYALLSLSGREGFNYPGLALIDFPINFADKTSVADRENFLIEPFVTLAKSNPQVQVVVCGRSFAGLKGVNRIDLTHVWRQGVSG